jgi:hypothetical protein
MIRHYILDDDNNPIPCFDLLEIRAFLADIDRRIVAKTTIGQYEVSTVFLGIDHQIFEDAPPLIFETAIFGPEETEIKKRYSLWSQAEAGHKFICKCVEETNNLESAGLIAFLSGV